jgi:hypothetical protein
MNPERARGSHMGEYAGCELWNQGKEDFSIPSILYSQGNLLGLSEPQCLHL